MDDFTNGSAHRFVDSLKEKQRKRDQTTHRVGSTVCVCICGGFHVFDWNQWNSYRCVRMFMCYSVENNQLTQLHFTAYKCQVMTFWMKLFRRNVCFKQKKCSHPIKRWRYSVEYLNIRNQLFGLNSFIRA